MKRYYIGGFPPPYGGVTVKNRNLYCGLSSEISIEKIDLNRIKQKDFREARRLVKALLGKNHQFVIGVAGVETRKRFTHLLWLVNRKSMNRSVIMLMGGTVAGDIAADADYRKWASGYGKLYVETEGMLRQLEAAGLPNGAIYPNGRFRPSQETTIIENQNSPLRCVFFSQVSRDKGADLVLEAAKQLPGVEFAVYGTVVPEFRQEFETALSRCSNVQYHGVFQGEAEAVYEELSRYDVMLLPSRWKHEGVPGVLVETKIAGLAAVVSDLAYNAEIVHHGTEGLVLEETSAAALTRAVEMLNTDRDLLLNLKKGSRASAEKFYIENYLPELIGQLKDLL